MKHLLFMLSLVLSPLTFLSAANLPPYVQVQIDGIDQQIQQLETNRKQLEKQLAASQGMQKQQIQHEINEVDIQIKFRQDQKNRLLKSAR